MRVPKHAYGSYKHLGLHLKGTGAQLGVVMLELPQLVVLFPNTRARPWLQAQGSTRQLAAKDCCVTTSTSDDLRTSSSDTVHVLSLVTFVPSATRLG